jgi:hypothetical protein
MNSKISRTASIAEAELPAAQLNKLYQYKNQMAQAQQAQATQPEPTPAVSAPDPVTQGDLATLQQRRQKLDTILKLKKELETLIPRAERTWGGMDRGIRADVELDYPTPTTDKEYDELIALYTRQVQQLKNYIQRKRSLYKESVSECGGTGVIASKKQARDPRYSTSLTKDVRPGQIHKNLKAFQLAEEDIAWAKNKLSESNVEKLILRHIEFITQDIDEIKNRIATEKLPAGYVDLLKKKIADLEKQRVKLMFDPK